MLHYRTYELGPETDWVVFIHGAGGSSSIWYKQIRDFKEHFNVLLVDLRGHGASQDVANAADAPDVRKKSQYTFEDLSREVIEVMEHLDIERAHFVGISLGSIIIRTIGEIAPRRVHSMILGGAVVRLNLRSRFLVRLGHLFKRVMPYIWLYSLFAWIFMPKRRHRQSRLLFIREAKKLCQKEFIRWFKLTAEAKALLRFFEEKEIPVPTLYLMGEEDHMCLPPVRALVERHHHSTLHIFEDCGHVCNVDRPDLFNRHAVAFIQQHPYTALAA